ncbi:unnamed protein product [Dibothriocephalus latus]|uniref:Uncharacterized protein n=1 Tax=Dibothriocephalus latus TaxID=60516 RepID=A0A3P7LW43_DIBLA|nr:unnamed protein product [Dibothriocephalus latus]
MLDALTNCQSRAIINTAGTDCSASAVLNGNCPSDISYVFRAACVTVVGEGSMLNMSPAFENHETQAGTASSLLGGTMLAMELTKVEEIERLTGGTERLTGSPALGNFVMGMCVFSKSNSLFYVRDVFHSSVYCSDPYNWFSITRESSHLEIESAAKSRIDVP